MVATPISNQYTQPINVGPLGLPSANATATQWSRNQVIFRQDESPQSVFFIRSGVVRISTVTEDGRELILQFLGPGDMFGESALFDYPRSATTAIAHERATISTYDRDALKFIMNNDAALWARISRSIGQRASLLERRLGDLVFLPVRRRLEIAVSQLARKFGVSDGDAVLIPVKFSHAELARFIAASRVSVTLALGELERDGLVAQVGRRIRVQPTLLARTPA